VDTEVGPYMRRPSEEAESPRHPDRMKKAVRDARDPLTVYGIDRMVK
jgi:hypothetical protein